MSQSQPPAPREEHRFPCDQCGADLRFDPARAALVCDHCGNTEPLEGLNASNTGIRELDFRAALDQQMPEAEMAEAKGVSCPNCGARVELSETSHADECPYCATPVVTDTGAHRQIKPRGVAPFVLNEDAARDAMNDWLGRLWFAPNGLQEYARKGRRLQGIYVPFWTFDADTKTAYRGERGTVYTETRTVTRNGKTEQIEVQKTRWRPVSGHVARFFDDVLVLASRALPKRYTDALQPWDLSALQPYQPEFLAGFRAEAYAVQLDEGYQEAREYMNRVIERDVRFDIGGDKQRIHDLDTRVSDVTFKHILLPVWLAAYKYRGKSYRFVVNAQNGKVRGERPWSPWKIAIAVILGAIVAGVIGYLIAQNQ